MLAMLVPFVAIKIARVARATQVDTGVDTAPTLLAATATNFISVSRTHSSLLKAQATGTGRS
jgi:hypothetical protein